MVSQTDKNAKLQFTGNAHTRSVSAILLLSSQALTDMESVLVSFSGSGDIEDVSGKTIYVSENNLDVTADETGVTIPAFGGRWGIFRIILLDELSVAATYTS